MSEPQPASNLAILSDVPGTELRQLKVVFDSFREFVERYAPWLSDACIFVETSERVAAGTPIRLEIWLRDRPALIRALGQVDWVREAADSGEEGPPGVAIEITYLDPASARLIDSIFRLYNGQQGAPLDDSMVQTWEFDVESLIDGAFPGDAVPSPELGRNQPAAKAGTSAGSTSAGSEKASPVAESTPALAPAPSDDPRSTVHMPALSAIPEAIDPSVDPRSTMVIPAITADLESAEEPEGIRLDPPSTLVDPPSTLVDPPSPLVDPPSTLVDPPSTLVDPPSTLVDPPSTLVDPPPAAVDPPLASEDEWEERLSAAFSEYPGTAPEADAASPFVDVSQPAAVAGAEDRSFGFGLVEDPALPSASPAGVSPAGVAPAGVASADAMLSGGNDGASESTVADAGDAAPVFIPTLPTSPSPGATSAVFIEPVSESPAPFDPQPLDPQPLDSPPLDSPPVDSQLLDSQPLDSQIPGAQPEDFQGLDSQPLVPEPENGLSGMADPLDASRALPTDSVAMSTSSSSFRRQALVLFLLAIVVGAALYFFFRSRPDRETAPTHVAAVSANPTDMEPSTPPANLAPPAETPPAEAPVEESGSTAPAMVPVEESSPTAPGTSTPRTSTPNEPVSDPSPTVEPPAVARNVEVPPASAKVDRAGIARDVEQVLRSWAAAWSEQRPEGYIAAYAPDYSPAGVGRRDWEQQRRARIQAPASLLVLVKDINVEVVDGSTAVVSFYQDYETDTTHLYTWKTMDFARSPEGWRIVGERTGR